MPNKLVFGPFTLDTSRRSLHRDGVATELGQRACALLQALVRAEGNPVSKADLLDQVWPDATVEEGNLTVQIALLRKVLGLDADGRDWIVTVPRVGYRLVSTTTPTHSDGLEPSRPTLAVLPFQNLSGEAEAEYFADGIVADIITALSRFQSLAVVSRNSSFVYKGHIVDTREVARALGAGYVLEGSVRRSGDRLRITAQLVEGHSGVTLWTDRFDGNLAEIFDFQDQITESVATVVAPAIAATELALSRQKRPESVATYDVYLRAQALLDDETEAGNAAAYAILAEALTHEPENAMILSHAAWALEHRTSMGWQPIGPDDVERCVDYARRGIRLAGGDPRILARCAVALIQPGKDYEAGMAVIEAAARTNPNDLYVLSAAGVLNTHCGDLDRALDYFHRALRLAPTDPVTRFPLTGIAHVQIVRGNYDESLEYAARALAINDKFDATYWMLIAANAQLGRMDRAQQWLATLLSLSPGVTVSTILAAQSARFPDRFAAVAAGLRLAGMQ